MKPCLSPTPDPSNNPLTTPKEGMLRFWRCGGWALKTRHMRKRPKGHKNGHCAWRKKQFLSTSRRAVLDEKNLAIFAKKFFFSQRNFQLYPHQYNTLAQNKHAQLLRKQHKHTNYLHATYSWNHFFKKKTNLLPNCENIQGFSSFNITCTALPVRHQNPQRDFTFGDHMIEEWLERHLEHHTKTSDILYSL